MIQYNIQFFRDINKFKYRTYLFLNRPRGFFAIGYQILLILLITACIIMTMIFTMGNHIGYKVLFWFDLSMLIIFFTELIVRVWASTCITKYKGWRGMARLIINPWFILDLAVIALTITTLCYDQKESVLSVLLRGFRMLHFFENRYKIWRMVTDVIWSQRYQLAVLAYICLLGLFMIAFLMYYIEVFHNPNINTVADAVWYTVVTYTTVGYGDIAPCTTAGKIVMGFAMVIGVSIFAMPGGVIGAGIALKIEDEANIRTNHFRRNFAALVIQEAWRVYWIEEKLLKRRPEQHVTVQLRCTKQNIKYSREMFGKDQHMNTHALQFLFLLRFMRAKSKFKLSNYLCDDTTFYETYTNNQLSNCDMVRGLGFKIDKIEGDIKTNREMFDKLVEQNETLASLLTDTLDKVAEEEERRRETDEADLEQKKRKHSRGGGGMKGNFCKCCCRPYPFRRRTNRLRMKRPKPSDEPESEPEPEEPPTEEQPEITESPQQPPEYPTEQPPVVNGQQPTDATEPTQPIATDGEQSGGGSSRRSSGPQAPGQGQTRSTSF